MSAQSALEIIVVSDGSSNSSMSDQYVLRMVLALITLKVQGNILVEIRDKENLVVLDRLANGGSLGHKFSCSGIVTRDPTNRIAIASMLSQTRGLVTAKSHLECRL